MSVWLVRGGPGGIHEQRMLDKNFVSIGWIDLPDLSKIKSREQLEKLYIQTYPEAKKFRKINHVTQIWSFINRIQKKDLVVVPLKTQSAIAIGEMLGKYEYITNLGPDLHHIRTVKWIETDIPRTAFEQDLLYSFGAYLTVGRVKANNAEERVRDILKGAPVLEVKAEEEIIEEESLDVEQIARDQIMKYLEENFKGHALAELMEAILQAQGYVTKRSAPGPDGGVDILAGSGPMGFENPKLCVQVKSGSSPADVNIWRNLKGTMDTFGASQGLLISWSGFNRAVIAEARREFFKIRLWDSGEILNMIFKYYDKLSDTMQAALPLKRLWALATGEETE